jgi:hypothetical protein
MPESTLREVTARRCQILGSPVDHHLGHEPMGVRQSLSRRLPPEESLGDLLEIGYGRNPP